MGKHQHVHTCRWAVPTLFLPYPLWLSTEDTPWSCVRDGSAEPLETTETCVDCPRFERVASPQPENPGVHASRR
jgi:hypothetical protein